ncbi:hypothetical protein L0F67_07690 [Actinobacillus suis]|uniref:Uncharacterized protein n=4 Tax=Actinobacillus suis TaxID=716 RepID=K0G4V1_ACTSU|nr:hypothetical protein [Actinobacillus suis]AFU18604.1 hypothetical protein ASU2_02310 [Actinobacillus suis H91-0380]AIJ30739.1 hypothetical protein ASU1_02315 [Actinobacillus suis ATCC 33415]MCO4167155.1 hypothetical protein [Actinobacillus suis]MCO4169285.1 hypothetical protein [Actinobacillus suis]MCQ9711858.1 hypothetical protein [Actinobacillus suis]
MEKILVSECISSILTSECTSLISSVISIFLGIWSILLTKKYKKLSDTYEKWQDLTYENINNRILNISIDIDDIKKRIPKQNSGLEVRKTDVSVSKFKEGDYTLTDQKRIKEKIQKHLSPYFKSVYLESLVNKLILNNKDSGIIISLRNWHDEKNKLRELESNLNQLFRTEGLIFSILI